MIVVTRNLQPEMGYQFLQTHAKFVELSNAKKNAIKAIGGEAVKIAMFGHKRVPSHEGGSVIITLCSNMQSSTKNKEAAEKVEAKIHKSAEEFLK